MNNRKLIAMFFGIGFLVLLVGVFSTTQDYGARNNGENNTDILPQTVNQGAKNIMPDAINQNDTQNKNQNNTQNNTQNNAKMTTDPAASENIKTSLDKIEGIDNVSVALANNCALISCNVSDKVKSDKNYKQNLIDKTKQVHPKLLNVYIMENTDKKDMNFDAVSNKFRTMDMSGFDNFFNNMFK